MRGAEALEFTLNLLPFMIMVVVLVDTSWAIYTKATLQQAVRMAVRDGVTVTTTTVSGNLTATVKTMVQQHANGILNGSTGLGYIKVHYFDQNNPSSDVSNQTYGNQPGNIMQVSVENYQLHPLMSRFFNWSGTPDASPMNISVYAADMIEPMASNLVPPIGPAP